MSQVIVFLSLKPVSGYINGVAVLPGLVFSAKKLANRLNSVIVDYNTSSVKAADGERQ
jgi:hypothetical protein